MRSLATTLATWRKAGTYLVPALALLGAEPSAQARPSWASGTFVYADLCTLPESGTRAGQRVILRRSPNGDGLTYEDAEKSVPVTADTMTLNDTTKALAFVVETDAGALQFEGVAAPDALTGTLSDEAGAHPVRLPRVLRSHAHEACPDESTASVGGGR